jgi:hypothetical protein
MVRALSSISLQQCTSTQRHLDILFRHLPDKYRIPIGQPRTNCHFNLKELTTMELTTIQKKAMNIIFAKCGLCRNTARVILFEPACLGGASFRHLYSEQGVGQIQLTLKHWRTPTTQTGRLIRIVVHWAQFAVGTGTPFLTDVSTKLPHMEVKWFASLRQYLNHIGGSIELEDPGPPQYNA